MAGAQTAPTVSFRRVRRPVGAALLSLLVVLGWSSAQLRAANAEAAKKSGAAPCRIASLILAGDEILLDLLPRRCLRAVSTYARISAFSNVAEKAKGIPTIAHNIEQIIHLQPDLVILASYSDLAFKRLLRAVGIPIYEYRQFNSINEILGSIRELGTVVGARDRAEELVAELRLRLAALQERAGAVSGIRVLYYTFGGFVHGEDTSIGAVIRASGGRNVATDWGVKGFQEIPDEVLLRMNPDLLLMGSYEDDAAVRAQMRRAPLLRHLPAVKRGAVYAMPHALTGTVSQYAVRAAEVLQDILFRYRRDMTQSSRR